MATRVGYAALSVDTSEKELSIDIKPSAETVAPGDTVTYTLTIRDSAGNPVPDVSTSVALVDKAVLVLGAGYQDTRSLIDIFYYERPLGVTTGSLIVINKDRVSAQLAEGGKGGGGGGGDGGPEVREEFPDTAFWRADFVSDANGVIEFAVKLPDNLTTWVLTAKGVNDGHAGRRGHQRDRGDQAAAGAPCAAALPRGGRPGHDRRRGAQRRRRCHRERRVHHRGQRRRVPGGAEPSSPSTWPHPATSPPSPIPIAVDATASSVVVTMTAVAGDLSDAVRIELPVQRYQTPETVGTSGVVESPAA